MEIQKPSILLVSVDALKPEFVFEQERIGISLLNLSRHFIENGTVAGGGVQSVFPTFTYPCHQSIITGVCPATHGIINNGIFDPEGTHKGAWHWFASKKVKNLWEAARENGYCSASVAFPTSVGAGGDYIAPEFWWDGSELDSLFIDAVSAPQGIIREMEQEIGKYAGGLDLTEAGDVQRYKASMWMLKHKIDPHRTEKPFFLSAYFASFDESAHIYGVYSPEAKRSLEKIDTMLGQMIDEVSAMTDGNVVVCIVSDHGSLDNRYNINPNVLLARAGLIELDEEQKVTGWRAWSQRAGGACEIRIKDPDDFEAAEILSHVIDELKANPESGILEVLTRDEAKARGGFPMAEYVLVSEKGYEIRDNTAGSYCTARTTQKAQHGYSEFFEEMRASFLIKGTGIEKGGDIGRIRLIDIAPTLAAIMGASLPEAEGKNVFK